jgi:squalene-hopene/tetraprenyl-beta-curcumene cyclase
MKKIFWLVAILVVCFSALPMQVPTAGAWAGLPVGPNLHLDMTPDALGGLGLTPDQISTISYWAGEVDSIENRTDAVEAAFEYLNNARSGYPSGAWQYHLGFAIHYIEDAVCPPHVLNWQQGYIPYFKAHTDFEYYTHEQYGSTFRSYVTSAPTKSIGSSEYLRDQLLLAQGIVGNMTCMYWDNSDPPEYIINPTPFPGFNCANGASPHSGAMDDWEMCDSDIGECLRMAASLTKGAAIWVMTSASSSIEDGLGWLRNHQNVDGSWYNDPAVTSLAVLAMLNWGYDESDEIVAKGINYVLSNINPDGTVYNQDYRYTYYTSIAILPLAATGNAEYYDEIQSMRDWLIGSQWDENSFYGSVDPSDWYYGGFGYGNGWRPDLSNTQWALVGVKAADRVLGLEATDTYAKAADYFLERCQNPDGGSYYTPGGGSIHTMTAASVWSYALCGRGSSNEALAGIQWLTDNYSLTNNDGWGYWSEYYYKLTLAKALTMTHKVMLGGHNWFDELAQKLADEQYPEGNWPDTGMMGSEMSTCWAIMALQTRTLPPSGDFGMWATLESHCDLHMYDSLGRHTGVNYVTGMVEENIPGSDFRILDSGGNEVPYSGETPGEGYRQVIELSGLVPGSYRIELVGTSNGPYHLTVVGLSDGIQVSTHTFEGTVTEGERLATNAIVTSMEGALTLLYEPLITLPVLGVDPNHIEVVGAPSTVAGAAFTVSEIGGAETLHDVTTYCTDIVGVQGLIDGNDVTFDINDFDIAPGGSQAVNASIPVPADFSCPGVGSIIVESTDGGTREITLTLLTDITPPPAPSLLSPANWTATNNNTVPLDWSDVADTSTPVQYQVQADNNSDFSTPEYDSGWISVSSATTSALGDNTYNWRARAKDSVGNVGDWSVVWQFTVDTTPPVAPTLVSPGNATITNDNTVDLDWSDVTDPSTPASYQVQVDNSSDFSSPEYDSGWISPSNATTPASADNIYYWRARVEDGVGNIGNWSTVWQFTVDTTPPQVVITSPAQGQTYLNTEGTIPVQYTATDNLDKTLDIVVTLDGNLFTGDKINLCGMASGQHMLTVSATDDAKNTGTASSTFTLVPKAMKSFVVKNLAIQWAPHTPKWQGSDSFSIFGRLQLPQGYTWASLQNQATITISIGGKSGNDTVVLKAKPFGKPQSTLWSYRGSEQPPGYGMNINNMVIWLAPQGTNWNGWAGFYIGGVLQLPEPIGINTTPTNVKVTLEIPVTTAAGCGSLTGEQTLTCKVNKPWNLWTYNVWPNLPTFPYDATGRE